jgi:hypothetical protein
MKKRDSKKELETMQELIKKYDISINSIHKKTGIDRHNVKRVITGSTCGYPRFDVIHNAVIDIAKEKQLI